MIIGSIIIRTNERYISFIYREIDIGEGSDIFVIDSSGAVVSSRNTGIPISEKYEDAALVDKVLESSKNGSDVFNYNMGGKNYLVAFAPLKNADWYVVGTIPFSYLS